MIKKIIIIIYVLFCGFSISHAAVEIREVMYDPEGSDTNREWIEIYNNGSSVDIESWYFHENDTYHGLYPEGFSSLENRERALIVKDVASAQSELGSGIKYIKSSFSLNNTSETLVIADSNKISIDAHTYSSTTGGNGNGDSLQLIGSSWVSSSPTPGEQNSSSGESNNGSNIDNDNDDDENVILSLDPYYSPRLEIPDVIIAKADFNFLAEVDRVKGTKKIREINGYYYINFGDGNILESKRRVDTSYSYMNAGDYIFVFEYYTSRLAFNAGEEPDSFLKKSISVIGDSVEIVDVNVVSGITLQNKTGTVIDLDSWKLVWNDEEYIFPRYSYINKNNKISILFSTLGFSPSPSSVKKMQLLSNASELISSFPSVKKVWSVVKTEGINKESLVKSNGTFEEASSSEGSDFFGDTDSYLEQYLYDNPNKLEVDFGHNNELLTAGVHNTKNKSNSSIYYALGSLVLILGAARFTKHRDGKESSKEEKDFGTIEVIE